MVELDPVVTELFRSRPLLTALNDDALDAPRVTVHREDAMRFLEGTASRWDVILMDLPDPTRAPLEKLYSRAFFDLVGRHLAAGGLLACQATSPYRSREAFWCIAHTIEAARCGPRGVPFQTAPYQPVVPTFGAWGFVLAGEVRPDPAEIEPPERARYLTAELAPSLFVFPPDMAEVETPVSRLDRPVVGELYRAGYSEYLN